MTKENRTIPLVGELSKAAYDCPLAPPDHASVFSRALHRACLIVGGVATLAKRLHCAEEDLRAWMRGNQVPPEAIFIHCVEIILLYASGKGAAN